MVLYYDKILKNTSLMLCGIALHFSMFSLSHGEFVTLENELYFCIS